MNRLSVIAGHLSPDTSVPAHAAQPLLAGQVVVVTGSGQGIGREAALLFARQGAAVVVSDLDAAKSDSVAREIASAGGRAISHPGDVTDPGFPDAILKRVVEQYGKVTVVVNNAGYTWDAVIHKMTDKQWVSRSLGARVYVLRLI